MAPERSLDQRLVALKKANDIRVKRAQLKREIKAGDVTATQILAEPPEFVATMKIVDLLIAMPMFGRVKAARFMNACRVSQTKTIGGLSPRQSDEIIRVLGGNR